MPGPGAAGTKRGPDSDQDASKKPRAEGSAAEAPPVAASATSAVIITDDAAGAAGGGAKGPKKGKTIWKYYAKMVTSASSDPDPVLPLNKWVEVSRNDQYIESFLKLIFQPHGAEAPACNPQNFKVNCKFTSNLPLPVIYGYNFTHCLRL